MSSRCGLLLLSERSKGLPQIAVDGSKTFTHPLVLVLLCRTKHVRGRGTDSLRRILVRGTDVDEHNLGRHSGMNKRVVDLGYRLSEALDEPFHVAQPIFPLPKREEPECLDLELHVGAW